MNSLVKNWLVVDQYELGKFIAKTIGRDDYNVVIALGRDDAGHYTIFEIDLYEDSRPDEPCDWYKSPTVEDWLASGPAVDDGRYHRVEWDDQPSLADMIVYLNKNHNAGFPEKFHLYVDW